MRALAPGRERERCATELWALLQVALQHYARRHAGSSTDLSTDDIRELAADKASELLRRLDSREWDPAGSPPAQLCAFLATAARNGVVDFHRRRRREVPISEEAMLQGEAPEASAEALLDAAVYARTILECASNMTDRARRAWLLRVLYELDSADIARDAGVASTAAGVDMMLARCRTHMRSCMDGKGLALRPLPPGTFVWLWDMTRAGGDA